MAMRLIVFLTVLLASVPATARDVVVTVQDDTIQTRSTDVIKFSVPAEAEEPWLVGRLYCLDGCEVWPTLYTELQYFNFMSKVKAMSDNDPSTTVSTLGGKRVKKWDAQPAVEVTTQLAPGESYVLGIGGSIYLDPKRKDTVKVDLQLQYKVPSMFEKMKRKLK